MELFLDNLLEVVVAVNGFLWNFLLLFILCGVGIYYTFKLKFIQVRNCLLYTSDAADEL